MFGETGIEVRSYGKSEFAERMGIGLDTLRKRLDMFEAELQKLPHYYRRSKFISPAEIRMYLKFFGHIE